MALFYHFFRYPIPYALQEGLQVVTAVGVGLSLSTPILILQAAMPLKEMAAATSAWQLTRALGGSIGQSPPNPIPLTRAVSAMRYEMVAVTDSEKD